MAAKIYAAHISVGNKPSPEGCVAEAKKIELALAQHNKATNAAKSANQNDDEDGQ
jgi:hypothetical protein